MASLNLASKFSSKVDERFTRESFAQLVLGNKYISIHASAREATPSSPLPFARLFNFNPRLREGGDRGAFHPA